MLKVYIQGPEKNANILRPVDGIHFWTIFIDFQGSNFNEITFKSHML